MMRGLSDMVGRVWVAYQVEVSKALRQRITYLGPLLVLSVVLLAPLIHPLRQDGISDYDFIAFATPLALNLLGLILLLVFAAMQVSSELGSGVVRTVLVRPILRHDYLIGKLLIGMTYAVALSLTAAAGAWLLVLAFGDFAGVAYGGEIIYTDREMRHAYLLGLGLNLLPQWAAVSFATMLSVLTRNTGAAIAGVLGVWLAADILKHPLRLAPYLVSTYTELSWSVFQERCDALATSWFPPMYIGLLATSFITFAICAPVALVVLARKNLSV
jgi:ABC-type transport system involved in multi-copper enzyme maturation permease subunit